MNINSFVEIVLGTVIAPSSKTIFTPVQFFPPDLTGASSLAPQERFIFHYGDNVVLTSPLNYNGRKFTKWQVRNDGVVMLESIDNPLTITITGNLTVYAMYEPISITSWTNITIGADPIAPLELSNLSSFVELTSV